MTTQIIIGLIGTFMVAFGTSLFVFGVSFLLCEALKRLVHRCKQPRNNKEAVSQDGKDAK